MDSATMPQMIIDACHRSNGFPIVQDMHVDLGPVRFSDELAKKEQFLLEVTYDQFIYVHMHTANAGICCCQLGRLMCLQERLKVMRSICFGSQKREVAEPSIKIHPTRILVSPTYPFATHCC